MNQNTGAPERLREENDRLTAENAELKRQLAAAEYLTAILGVKLDELTKRQNQV